MSSQVPSLTEELLETLWLLGEGDLVFSGDIAPEYWLPVDSLTPVHTQH